MRIALINSIRFYGGGEKRTLRMAQEFRGRGHDARVLGLPGSELGDRCGQSGIPFHEVTLGKYYARRSLQSLAAGIKAAQPEVLITFDERTVRSAALLRRLSPGSTPPLIHYYGLEGAFKNKPLNRWLVSPQVACFVPNAEAIADELRSFGWIPRDRIRVIYDGVDPTAIQTADATGVRGELGASPEDVVAVVVARLVPEKGHAFLLEVLHRMNGSAGKLKVWIVGEGPEEPALREKIKTFHLESRVHLLGFRSDVPRLLRAADVLCHPSRREGAPNAVREGMVAGLPVVAVAASGTPELMEEGKTGFLSAIGDGEALQRNLERVLADGELRKQMGAAGRERALKQFSEDRCAAEWLALLEACIRCGSR